MRVLVTGGRGLLGSALLPELERRGHEVVAPARGDLDLTDPEESVHARVVDAAPRAVVNLAAFTDVDGAESEPEAAFATNRDGAGKLAGAAVAVGARLLHLSTDYVFDGTADHPIPVDAPVRPLGIYGRSKAEGENAVRARGGSHLIVRSSWLYGSGGKNFVDAIVSRAREGGGLRVVGDQRGSPTWTRSLARGLAALLELGAEGTLHLTDEGDATWHELAVESIRLSGLSADVHAVSTDEWGARAPRPRYSVLDLARTRELMAASEPPTEIPHWKVSLSEYLAGRASS